MQQALRPEPPRDAQPPEERPSLAPVSASDPPAPPPALEPLLERVQAGALEDREVPQLVRAFAALARVPNREAADRLLQALTLEPLRLYKHDGLTLHTYATEALLDLGHPFALEVPPEALEEAVADRAARDRRRETPWIGWGIFAAGLLISACWVLSPGRLASETDAPLALGAVTAFLEAAAFAIPLYLASRRKSSLARAFGVAGLIALGALEIGLGAKVPTGPIWQLAFGGAVKMLSAPFFLRRRKRRS